jgi:nitrogen fixation NifU-like protein
MADTGNAEALYQEQILAHFRRPHGKGALASPDAVATVRNPACGEALTVTVAVDRAAREATNAGHGPSAVIGEVRFSGDACSLATASASMMTEIIPGKTVTDVDEIARQLRAVLAGQHQEGIPEPLRAFTPVARVPGRSACVMLAWEAVHKALLDRP